MTVDITPIIPDGKKIIESYGDGSFTVSGEKYTGSIIVTPNEVIKWDANQELALESFAEIIKRKDNIDVLLFGSGENVKFVEPKIRRGLGEHGITIDEMNTGAACRTYNVLLSEERKVAAILLAF